MKYKSKIIIAVSFLLATNCVAQKKDDNLGDEQVVIVKGYKPVIANAVKVSDSPEADTSTSTVPKMTYEIQPTVAATDFVLAPIKPIKVKDENIKELYRGFVKAGYGTQSTPYGEIWYNALRSKEFNAGIHLKHLSSRGEINGYGFPDNSHNTAEIFGRKYFDHSYLGAAVGYQREVYHYYGDTLQQETLGKSATEHRFNDVHADLSYKSLFTNDDDVDHQINLGFYNVKDNFNTKEGDFYINGTVAKKLGPGKLSALASVDLSKIEQSIGDVSNGLILFKPTYKIKLDPWDLEGGVSLQVETFKDSSKAHIYPFIHLNYELGKNASAFGEFSGGLKKNTFRNALYENPFLTDTIGIANTDVKLNMLLGVSINIDQSYKFMASINYQTLGNAQFYLNTKRYINIDTIGYPVTAFTPVYYDGSLLNLHGELSISTAKKLEVVLKADYYKYNLNNDSLQPWHVSPVQVGLDLIYNLSDKIILKSDWFINSSAQYFDASTGEAGKLKTIADFNLGIDYRYSKVLSVYAQLNNVGFQKYQRWYNYPSYKFNAIVGLSYSF